MLVFLFVCQSDYMFRPQLGHHLVTSKLYDIIEGARLAETCSHFEKQIKRTNVY